MGEEILYEKNKKRRHRQRFNAGSCIHHSKLPSAEFEMFDKKENIQTGHRASLLGNLLHWHDYTGKGI